MVGLMSSNRGFRKGIQRSTLLFKMKGGRETESKEKRKRIEVRYYAYPIISIFDITRVRTMYEEHKYIRVLIVFLICVRTVSFDMTRHSPFMSKYQYLMSR